VASTDNAIADLAGNTLGSAASNTLLFDYHVG
jgi:hypothetical protein